MNIPLCIISHVLPIFFFFFFGLQFFKAKSPQGMPPRVPQFSLGNSTHPNIHTQYFYSQSQVRDFTSRQQLLSVKMAPPTWRTGFFFSFSPFGINRRRPGPYYRSSRSAVHWIKHSRGDKETWTILLFWSHISKWPLGTKCVFKSSRNEVSPAFNKIIRLKYMRLNKF